MSDKLAIFSQLVLDTVVMLSMQGINQLPGLESRRVSTRLEDFYVQLDNAAKGPYSRVFVHGLDITTAAENDKTG
jgi:hypothetical protein